MDPIARLDQRYVWHPFTQMRDWLKREPIVIASGQGSILTDTRGRRYLDANSSIWTNLHGHNHPQLNRAITTQLKKIAHSSALGLANEPASQLAEKLISAARPPKTSAKGPSLNKVFFSDDGSTAMEVALKLACQVARRKGDPRPKFVSLDRAYHGDTVGAVSLGHIDIFHKSYSDLIFKTDKLAAPYCYRCPYNRAKPQRADAREYQKCQEECLTQVEKVFETQQRKHRRPYAGFVFEPTIQGAAGMIAQPAGWIKKAARIAQAHGAPLIADEVLTGFGRTGLDLNSGLARNTSLFACHREGVRPDYLALAKGMTGGYLPMAATLTTQKVFDAFLGDYSELKTFFHGHSFTGNQLGAASSLANLELLGSAASLRARTALQKSLEAAVKSLWDLPNVGDIRQAGLIVGIELVQDWRTRKAFDFKKRVGMRVCEAMAKHGVLTRPIGDVIVIMPPYCTTSEQLNTIFTILRKSIGAL